jgi:beta-glucosidase/6-phospho-beta-glucosidase/beta-galactosidase
MPISPLPDSFLFGVAISDHQSEAHDERFPPDVWDVWERREGVVPRGRATDFWNRWQEDVDNAQRIGCRAFRFSISWARVEPLPGEFDLDALDHYRRIVRRLRELDMEPIVTLCHFVWPQHVEKRDGLCAAEFPTWFANYAARVRAALDPHVRYWITFNEPNILLQGYTKLWFQSDYGFPPGHPLGTPMHHQIDTMVAVIRHLFIAHAAARRMLRAGENGDRNLVSANVFQLGLPPILQRLVDRNVERLKQAEDWREQFWRVTERPTLLQRRVDLVIAPALDSQLELESHEAAFYITGLGALVRGDSAYIELTDLRGKRIALVRGPQWEQAALAQLHIGAKHVDRYATHDEALKALDEGRADALVANHTVLHGLAHVSDMYRVLGERLLHQPYVVAVETGRPALVDAVQHAIGALQTAANGAIICRHYFPSRTPAHLAAFEPLPRAPRVSGLGQIQDRGKVIVGVTQADVPRFDRTGSAAHRHGVEFDLGRALAGVIFGDAARVEFRRASLPRRGPGRRPSLGARLRVRVDEWLRAYTIFSTFIASSWWYKGMRGRLPDYLCPPDCVDQLDFVSFDYYFGVSAPTPRQLQRLAKSVERKFNVTALWAGGLYQSLRYYHEMFPDLPILIAENGFAGEPNSNRRGEQIAEHVRAVQQAVAEGIDVRAYCVWSITSNREWGLPQHAASDFGLYYVDMDGDPELNRRETPSAQAYRRLIERRGAA